MSYDVGLYVNTGIEEHEIHDCGNYTYNVGPMYYKAFGKGGLGSIDGRIAKDATDDIEQALIKMIVNQSDYEKLNPDNGWGDYDGAVKYLSGILSAAKDHPEATIIIY